MGSQRIASSLINRPYHPPGWGEPALGEEPGEGEDGYTNPPLEDGYSELSDGVIVDMQATLRELFDNPDLEMNQESFRLQSLGEAIEFNCSPNSGGEYEGQEGGPGESEYIDPLCACEQSLYWATEAGYDSQTLNVIYFYHPDYLGSVEYVSDMKGEPYQFFLNTPWGENLENQFAKNYTSFSSRFRFNGKEWDEETGNFYYGARYYDPKISVWLSVDRLADKYPGMSPYNFTMNNPLNLIDPNGDSVLTRKQQEAEAIVKDLNNIYKDEYGFEGAFSIETKTKTVKERTNDWSITDPSSWGNIFEDPEYTEKTITEYAIVGNENFDWDRDKYTEAFSTLMSQKGSIYLDIIQDKGSGLLPLESKGLLLDYGGGFTKQSNWVLLSNKLPFSGSNKRSKWTLGGVVLHELLYHVSPLGLQEGGNPNRMRNYYNLKTGRRHGPGSRQFGPR